MRAVWLVCLAIAVIAACSAADEGDGVATNSQAQTAQQCDCTSEQFCVDGVCCDTACTGDCVACTAALKGSGVDGVCGPIAAGTDPEDECAAQGVTSCGLDGSCDGASACRRYPAGSVCRDAVGECDVAEQCPGQGAACPADDRQNAGVGCTSDGNPCTLDQCNGTSADCQHPAGNQGAACRAAAGECDLAEVCTGSSATCPADEQKSPGTPCVSDDGNPCTTDRCDGTSVVCQHDPGNPGTVCRDPVGLCDAPETCTGTSETCPPDVKRPATFVCRPAADDCDAAERCAGGDNCPVDGFLGSNVECRGPSCSSAVATLPANCPGNSAACPPVQTQNCAPSTCSGNQCGGCTTNQQCPGGQYCSGGVCANKKPNGQQCSEADECTSNACADGVCCNTACNAGICDSCVNTGSVGTCSAVPANTECRPAAGECDVAETCGGATACPADAKRQPGSACTDDDNPCTTDTCNGSAVSCQHAAGNAGTLCRAANGSACDVADHCDGTSTACADDKRPSTFTCRDAAGECDVAERCDGTTDACPSDARRPSGSACTDDGNPCTLDRCEGGVACQHPAGNAGTACRDAVGPCDLAESCNGTSTACPNDAKRTSSFSCRAAAGDCDLAETCDGTGDACPADVKRAAGAACPNDGNPCTTDTCNGSSNSCQHAAGNAGTECRAAAGPCDLAEACTGSATCPADVKRPSTFVCRAAPGACDVEERCSGTGDSCPADVFRPSTFQCRGASCASGVATLAANCTGGTALCPNPMTQSCPQSQCNGSICANGCTVDGNCSSSEFCSGGVCRPKVANGQPCGTSSACVSGNCADGVCCNTACNSGVCDSCALSGSVGTCTAVAATTVCRPAVGECDIEERCGGAMACPADANRNGQSCTSDGNVCTTDACVGSACTHAAAPASTPCRAAAGECDVAETCGGATTCPADAFRANGTACSSDSNPCTADACQGGTCAHPAANAGVVCRAAAGECDEPELCNGTSTSCPSNALKPSGTACSGDGNVCTRDECLIGFCTHLAGNAGTVCREAVGECDQAESCTGITTACPSDGFRSNGTTCTSDSNPCTRDVCESGVCAHPAGNSGTVCRAAATDCDAAELCTGSSSSCPANAGKPNGASCSDDGVPCTRDQCSAGACTHPSNDGATCSDGNACTSSDTCSAAQCRGAPVPGCVCTMDARCNDGNPCNGVETCVGGTCRQGTPLDCDDGKACTTDGCNPASGCTHVNLPNGAPCDDGQYCTTDDACNADTCVSGPARDCGGAAMGPCRRAMCDEAADECVAENLPDTQTCDDENVCTGNDRCNAGVCRGQQRLNCRACTTGAECDDSNPCTTDLCNDIMRACDYLVVTGCVPDPPDGGDAGDADAPEGGGDAGVDASEDGSTTPPDGGLDGAPGGAAGTQGAGGAGGGVGGSAGTAGEGDGTYTKDEYGACACRAAGGGARGWAFAAPALAALALAARFRTRRRRR